jgi:hypothetical protein
MQVVAGSLEITYLCCELFDVRNPAESGNKNGCQVITQLPEKLG